MPCHPKEHAMTAASKTKKPSTPTYLSRETFRHLRDAEKLSGQATVALQKENFGWPIYLVRQLNEPIVAAGCRWYPFELAQAHWGEMASKRPCRRGCTVCKEEKTRGTDMIALLPKLKRRARRLGWLPRA